MTQCDLKNERCGFKCTGYEGHKIWEKLHTLPKEIDCEECSAHASDLFRGLHDHVNVGLGKDIHSKANYAKFVDEVKCVYDSCLNEGRC